jgi:hypothetical protein
VYYVGFYTLLLIVFLSGCDRAKNDHEISNGTEKNTLEFSMIINKKAFYYTNYGDPPQIAIWIEDLNSKTIQTVWVTRCAATNKWRGKVVCPTALPVWENQHLLEKKTADYDIDVNTGATPLNGLFTVTALVPQGSQWNYYVEVNAAGDYNTSFPYWSSSGSPDSEGNGQPSIIYKGSIIADGKDRNSPDLIGRTDQRQEVHVPSEDLSGIDTAKELLQNIQVVSKG